MSALRLLLAVLRRPDLWVTAARAAGRFVPDRWWRRGPVPPRAYLAYRAGGIYGAPLLRVPPEDLIRYLEWCRRFPGPIR
jgi:hypothetical protein